VSGSDSDRLRVNRAAIARWCFRWNGSSGLDARHDLQGQFGRLLDIGVRCFDARCGFALAIACAAAAAATATAPASLFGCRIGRDCVGRNERRNRRSSSYIIGGVRGHEGSQRRRLLRRRDVLLPLATARLLRPASFAFALWPVVRAGRSCGSLFALRPRPRLGAAPFRPSFSAPAFLAIVAPLAALVVALTLAAIAVVTPIPIATRLTRAGRTRR